jgi:hypothetical protein
MDPVDPFDEIPEEQARFWRRPWSLFGRRRTVRPSEQRDASESRRDETT